MACAEAAYREGENGNGNGNGNGSGNGDGNGNGNGNGDGDGDGFDRWPDFEPYEIGQRSWTFETVISQPERQRSDATLALTPAGVAEVGWSEFEPSDTGIGSRNIWRARGAAGEWNLEQHTEDDGTLYFDSDLAASGESLYLVFRGRPESTQDIFFARRGDEGWTESNLSTQLDGGDPRFDSNPVILVRPGSSAHVVYSSAPARDSGGRDGPYAVRVVDSRDPTAPSLLYTIGPTSPDGLGCDEFAAAMEREGALHVVASCRTGDALYATNTAGSWQETGLDLDGASRVEMPSLALDHDDKTLHFAFIRRMTCSDDSSGCSAIHHHRLDIASGSLSTGTIVSDAPDRAARRPVVTVDPMDRILIVYESDGRGGTDDPDTDLRLAWSDDGGDSFEPPATITPKRSPGVVDTQPASLQLHPRTGLPQLVSVTTHFLGGGGIAHDVVHVLLEP